LLKYGMDVYLSLHPPLVKSLQLFLSTMLGSFQVCMPAFRAASWPYFLRVKLQSETPRVF